MSTLLEFSMFPTDKGESVSAYVSEIVAIIRGSGLPYQLTPMGTIVETEKVEQALALVKEACECLERQGCNRIYSSLKLDIRKGKGGRLKGKVASVEKKIGQVAT